MSRVAVIGAGLGGLACAYELSRRSVDVVVFEASDRVGGRVRSIRGLTDPNAVEAGGEFIGANHPTWLRFAKEFDLKLEEAWDPNASCWTRLDTNILDGNRADEIEEGALEIRKSLAADAHTINIARPWESKHARQWDATSMRQAVQRIDVSDLSRRVYLLDLELNEAADPDDVSYLGLLTTIAAHGFERYWSDTEAYRCRGGNQQLASRLAESLPGGSLRLKCPITHIENFGGGAVAKASDGTVTEADYALLAVSPAVWPRIEILPAIPLELRIRTGNATKFFATTCRRFWKPDGRQPCGMSDDGLGWVWEATPHAPDDGRTTLISYLAGPASDRLAAQQDHAREKFLMSSLEELFPGFQANLDQTHWMNWSMEKWIGNGFAYHALDQMVTAGPLLDSGINRLQFAGEWASFGFRGYMEGALESGIRAAERICRQL